MTGLLLGGIAVGLLAGCGNSDAPTGSAAGTPTQMAPDKQSAYADHMKGGGGKGPGGNGPAGPPH